MLYFHSMKRFYILFIFIILVATIGPSTVLLSPTPVTAAQQEIVLPAEPTPDDLWIGAGDLRVYPSGGTYYKGDLISFHIYAHHGRRWKNSPPPDVDVALWLGSPGSGTLIAEDRVRFYGRHDGEVQLEWVWDTAGLGPSPRSRGPSPRSRGPSPPEGGQWHTLYVVLDPRDEIQIGDENPDNNILTHRIQLRPRAEMPTGWADARWLVRESECCVFNYLSGTAAERDMDTLAILADEAIGYAAERLGETGGDTKLDVYLIDRVLGQGGLAREALILSYPDRFYVGGDWVQLFRHEGVHVLDQRFASVRPALLAEGLAVYVAGGHYREEPLDRRAAALLALDDSNFGGDDIAYIPLTELVDDFYAAQHEIAYLEAGAFVGFLIHQFGWEAYKAFYGDIERGRGETAAKIDAALREHFGLSLEQAESAWLATLQSISPPADQMTDLRLTIDFFETVRRYQQAWDPGAYFKEMWVPSLQESQERGITADWLRHPVDEVNLTLEIMFIAADRAIDYKAYGQVASLLEAIKAVLDAEGDLAIHPLAAGYRGLVQATVAAGYVPREIHWRGSGGLAYVSARAARHTELVDLILWKRTGLWQPVLLGR